jgi:heme a synthase
MNTPTDLYDLAPLGSLLALAAALALLPFAYLMWRHRHEGTRARLQALTVLVLFLTFDLIVFGAFTRLTDSGLGCPDWPGCYGATSPLGALHDIKSAQAAMPTGPVTLSKAWIEMIHRYLATVVGALIVALAWLSWHARRKASESHSLPVGMAWPMVTLVWVCVQGAFGAFTVTLKLMPLMVTLHLLGGMFLLALLAMQAVRYRHLVAPVLLGPGLRRMLMVLVGLLWLQMALGAWVSTNYAVMACEDFPLCHGQLWPPMSWEGFSLWRALGMTADGQALPFSALTAIHFVHRVFAVLVLSAMAGMAWRLGQILQLRWASRWMWALAALQLVSGLSNVVLDWPLWVALLHTAGAAAWVLLLTWLMGMTRSDTPAPENKV